MKRKLQTGALALVALSLALTGCAEAGEDPATSGDGPIELKLWTHSAGNPAELAVYEQIIEDFNASQSDYVVV
ncbi:MAG: hypothetical protein LBV00_04715, partial [Propionibacteriaceae bacterium]|nr:hypothetical protein [Propionibacteriaceae bacterium]